MSTCVRPVFVHGDHVVIRWIFRFEWIDGTVKRMEELACPSATVAESIQMRPTRPPLSGVA